MGTVSPTGLPPRPRVFALTPYGLHAKAGGSFLANEMLEAWMPGQIGEIYIPTLAEPIVRPTGTSVSVASSPCWPRSLSCSIRCARWYLGGQSLTADHLWTFRPSHELEAVVDTVDPEVIYTHVGPPWMISLALHLQERWGLPIVTHTMDDYVSRWPATTPRRRSVPLFALANKRLRAMAHELFSRATVRLTISDPMTMDYEARYSMPFQTITHAVDGTPLQGPGVASTNRLKLFFGGSINPFVNEQALKWLVDALPDLSSRVGRDVVLAVATPTRSPTAERLCNRSGSAEYLGVLTREQVQVVIKQSDALVLPFNHERGDVEYFRLSWPTKMVEYLLSGRPVVYIGPRETAVHDYLVGDGVGIVINAQEPMYVAADLLSQLLDHSTCGALAERAQAAATHDFDRGHRDAAFQMALQTATEGGRS